MLGFDSATGALVLPLWAGAALVAVLVALCAWLLKSIGRELLGVVLLRLAVVLMAVSAVEVVLTIRATGNFAAQRLALDQRAFDLTSRAVAPGSALACLDGIVDDAVEGSCEKALFATPESTAAAVSYVAAKLSLLADGSEYARRSGVNYESALVPLRRAVESDRFGIVAQVLAVHDGCTADQCRAFALLRDPSRVGDNLIGHKFDLVVLHHAAEWPASTSSPMAAIGQSAAAAPSTIPPGGLPGGPPTAAGVSSPPSGKGAASKLFFPSSASIPPVSIMTAEPATPPPSAAPSSPAAGAPSEAGGKPPPSARKPAQATQQASRRPTNLNAPLPIQVPGAALDGNN